MTANYLVKVQKSFLSAFHMLKATFLVQMHRECSFFTSQLTVNHNGSFVLKILESFTIIDYGKSVKWNSSKQKAEI